MVRYYSVTFKRGLFMVAYSDSKEKCEEYVRMNKTINFNGKPYKFSVELCEYNFSIDGKF